MTPAGLFVDDRRAPGDSRPPVVLVHGAPDRSRNFQAVAELLRDLPLVLYDRRGYGRSIEAEPPARHFHDHARDLLTVLDGRRAVLVAQSVGSNVAMTAAAIAPDQIAALGLWEPPTAWVDWWPTSDLIDQARAFAATVDTEALGEAFNRKILGDERWESLRPSTQAMLRAEGAAFRADMAAETVAPFEFGDIRCPTVIGYGTDTGSGHEGGAIRLAEVLGSELLRFPGADHFAPITRPDAFATVARRAYEAATRAR